MKAIQESVKNEKHCQDDIEKNKTHYTAKITLADNQFSDTIFTYIQQLLHFTARHISIKGMKESGT